MLTSSDGFTFEAEVSGVAMKLSIGMCSTVDDPCNSGDDDLITLKGSMMGVEVCMSSPGVWEGRNTTLHDVSGCKRSVTVDRKLEMRYPDFVDPVGHTVYTEPTVSLTCNEDVKDWVLVGGVGMNYQFESVHGERLART